MTVRSEARPDDPARPATAELRGRPTAASWWRRNRVLFTHLLPLVLVLMAVGWQLAIAFAPAKQPAVTNVYVVCPANPQEWCGVVHGHIVSRVRHP